MSTKLREKGESKWNLGIHPIQWVPGGERGGTPLRIKSQAFSMEIDLVVRDACSTVHLKNFQTTNGTDNLKFSI